MRSIVKLATAAIFVVQIGFTADRSSAAQTRSPARGTDIFMARCLQYPFQDTPKCSGNKRVVVSVTQENEQNNHKGSSNYKIGTNSYMQDFDKTSLSTWVNASLHNGSLKLALRFDDPTVVNKTTGWPLAYGHLFLGATVTDVRQPITKYDNISFETITKHPGSKGKGRSIIGLLLRWKEGEGRINTAHFFEIDLDQWNDYSNTFKDKPRTSCNQGFYDRCFYDPDGRYPEGRSVSLDAISLRKESGETSFLFSDFVKSLRWISPPANWDDAYVEAVYAALETTGVTDCELDVKSLVVSLKN